MQKVVVIVMCWHLVVCSVALSSSSFPRSHLLPGECLNAGSGLSHDLDVQVVVTQWYGVCLENGRYYDGCQLFPDCVIEVT